MTVLKDATVCVKCQNPGAVRRDNHSAGATLSCIICGHTFETDRNGKPYSPPPVTNFEHKPLESSPPSYPYGLACTVIILHFHEHYFHSPSHTVTPPDPAKRICMYVYHQPLKQPLYVFREPKREPQSDTRYIYATEMHPFDSTLAHGANRRLRDLIAQEASRISGFNLKTFGPAWPITQPGSIMATPLAPAI